MNHDMSQRKQGYTDAEARLDFEFLEEAHADWSPAEQIAAEKAWIRANGHRLTDTAQWAYRQVGPGVVFVPWDSWNEPKRLEETKYNTLADYVATASNEQMPLGRLAAEIGSERWTRLLAAYNPDRTFVVFVQSISWDYEIGIGHYHLGMPGGGKLPPWG